MSAVGEKVNKGSSSSWKMEKKRKNYKFNITPENIIVEKLDDELVVGTLRTD